SSMRPPPSGTTKAVALRRSGLTRTSVTVTDTSCSTGSRMSPRSSTPASAWRSSSPTRSWRCDGALDCRPFMSDAHARALRPRAAARPQPVRRPAALQLPGDLLELEGLDDVTDLDVVVVLEGHAAFVALAHLAHLVLEALQGLQRALVDDHVV